MKIKLELFGASRDFNKSKYLDLKVKEKSSIKDLKNELINYLDVKFNNNENFRKIVKSSVFCSEENKIIKENYIIKNNEKIAIIPPIGGG
jgi:sulfur-carrier protein